MKLTLSAAMRARDVSRPREDQLEDAESAEHIATGKSEDQPATAGSRKPFRRHRKLRDG